MSVASGKGGTGKTNIAANLALALDNVLLLDCDVEEPNAHIFRKPEIEVGFVIAGKIPYDMSITKAMVDGVPAVEVEPKSDAGEAIVKMWV